MFIVFYMIILRLQSYDCKNKGFPTFHNTNINYPCIFAKVNGRGRLPVAGTFYHDTESTNRGDTTMKKIPVLSQDY